MPTSSVWQASRPQSARRSARRSDGVARRVRLRDDSKWSIAEASDEYGCDDVSTERAPPAWNGIRRSGPANAPPNHFEHRVGQRECGDADDGESLEGLGAQQT